MIITEYVEVKTDVNNSKLDLYRSMGYDISSNPVMLKIEDLSKGSNYIISVKCDYCDSISNITYKSYNKTQEILKKYACSRKCASIKTKEINLIRYNVESTTQLDSVIEKMRLTNLERYGVENTTKLDSIKEKMRKTNLEKYGYEHASQSYDIRKKIENTCLERYGAKHFTNSEKSRITNLERYGVDNPMKVDVIKDKVKQTNLERYGVEFPNQSMDFRNQQKIKCIEEYGVSQYMKSTFILKKYKSTNLLKYGVEFPSQSNIIKNMKVENSLLKYGVEFPSQSKIIKNIKVENSLLRYGVDHPTKSNFFRKDFMNFSKNYIKYIGDNISLYNCGNGHEFEISSSNYHNRIKYEISMCTVCNPISDQKSFKEKELLEFIKDNYSGDIISGYRDSLEIDIYIPELKIGFEFNGLYWHSEKYKDRDYHLNKTVYFREKGIRIIHIWEDDWSFRKDILESQILNSLGKSKKIWARKCYIKELSVAECRKFLDDSHIQGFVSSTIKIGLYFQDDLVSLMTFNQFEGRNKMEEGGYNLSRFCNKLGCNIVGGASKLLSYFIKKYDPSRIVSYADKDWSVGDLYYTLGFKNIIESRPDYKYIVDEKRVHKSRYKKDRLNLEDKTKVTESQIMKERGIYRIYDCGKIKFEKIIKQNA